MFGGNPVGWAYLGQAYAGSAGVAQTLALDDTVNLSEAAAKTAVSARSDTLTLTEASAREVVLSKADTITLSDALPKAYALSIADTFALADEISNAVGVPLADNMTLEDAQETISAFLLSLDDTVTVSDQITTPGSDVVFAGGGGHSVVRDTSPSPRHFALSLEDTVVLQDVQMFQHEPDPDLEDFFTHLEALLERNLIPA